MSTRDGLLLVDKPAGSTSHDVVLVARRAIGEPRIGHTGTLDPFATGLLVLLLGRATRLLPYMSGEPKRYAATIRFGSETDTDDPQGAVVRTAPPPVRKAVEDALPTLTGTFEQLPPQFSAKRVRGKRAYDLARAGKEPELRPVPVTVHEWRVGAWRDADLEVEITCAGGTYVRALARDLGRLTGSAAHLTALRRTAIGPFRVEDAVSIADLREQRVQLRPPLDALTGIGTQRLVPSDITRVVRGQEVPATVAGDRAALLAGDSDTLVAFAERRGELWQPRVVMTRPRDEGSVASRSGSADG
ncbi:MAG TPA: tRNA pseudouridine(55) synthase TruB [Gemmatimonadaceae bacterium]|nr:tRNA pseudouridine(55) synthase TruB [Gemmatimonadaceae bacterium]